MRLFLAIPGESDASTSLNSSLPRMRIGRQRSPTTPSSAVTQAAGEVPGGVQIGRPPVRKSVLPISRTMLSMRFEITIGEPGRTTLQLHSSWDSRGSLPATGVDDIASVLDDDASASRWKPTYLPRPR